jgi:hypothetical protein
MHLAEPVVQKTIDLRACADKQAAKPQKRVAAWDYEQEEEEIEKRALQAVVSCG